MRNTRSSRAISSRIAWLSASRYEITGMGPIWANGPSPCNENARPREGRASPPPPAGAPARRAGGQLRMRSAPFRGAPPLLRRPHHSRGVCAHVRARTGRAARRRGEGSMRTWRWGAAVGAVVATLVISSASCGDDDNGGGGGAAPPQVDADPLHLEIQSVTIPEGANPRPVVRFRVTDQAGAPVDLMTELGNWNLGIPTAANRTVPNAVPRFTLAQLEDDGDYHSLYSATVAPRAFTSPGGPALPAADATQASYQ